VPVLPPSEDEKIIASFMEPSAGAEGQLGGAGDPPDSKDRT